ncbi:MAG: IclR family transcriptional regulator [Desulfuromusa sp.]|nr:IclR family transcriptional regulator [Desulfuromusa sp.]
MTYKLDISPNIKAGSYKLSTTVMKAFHLLEHIGSNQPVQPSQIVNELGLNRTNVHRLLATLIQIGYVVKTAEGFSLTFKLLSLGRSIPLSKDLRNTAKPYMIELNNKVNENIYLTVLVEDKVFAIDDVKSTQALTLNKDMAHSDPVHACASGKLFISQMSPSERQKYIDSLTLTKHARNTITDKTQLMKAAEEAGRLGYAKDIYEFSNEVLSIAAPIYNYEYRIIATLGISAPARRLSESELSGYLPTLLDATSEISHHFGSEQNMASAAFP